MYGNPSGPVLGGAGLLAATGGQLSVWLLVAGGLALALGALLMVRTRMMRRRLAAD